MDYEKALKKLKTDPRSHLGIEKASGIPYETIRDIRNEHVEPSLRTLRRLAKFYSRQGVSACDR